MKKKQEDSNFMDSFDKNVLSTRLRKSSLTPQSSVKMEDNEKKERGSSLLNKIGDFFGKIVNGKTEDKNVNAKNKLSIPKPPQKVNKASSKGVSPMKPLTRQTTWKINPLLKK